MRSWRVVEHGKPLAARDGPAPEPVGGEVLLRVTACGVCHSDLHFQDGHYNLGGGKTLPLARGGVVPPFTMGHEIAGEVVAAGPDAGAIEIGARRIVYPWIGCGGCRFCRGGEEMLCADPRFIGVFRDGGYATHVVVPHRRYLVAHDGLPAAAAASLACSGITAYSALGKTGSEGPDDHIVIVGLGGVGLSAVHFARHLIAGRVIAADIDVAKRESALQAGADLAIDNAAGDAVKAVREATGGGAAAVIDFVGAGDTAKFGLNCLRKGGTLVCVGLFGGALPLSLALMPLTQWRIRGSYVGSLDDLKAVVDLARRGRVATVATESRELDQANRALDDLRAGRVSGRLILTP